MTAPTKGLAQSAMQAAIVTLLAADAGAGSLRELVGTRILDAIPDNVTDDFVAIGEWTEESDDTLEDGDAGIGSSCNVTIEGYTDDAKGGAGYKRVQAIADRIKVLLHGSTLTLSGWVPVVCEHVDTVMLRDTDQAGRPKRRSISTYSVIAEGA